VDVQPLRPATAGAARSAAHAAEASPHETPMPGEKPPARPQPPDTAAAQSAAPAPVPAETSPGVKAPPVKPLSRHERRLAAQRAARAAKAANQQPGPVSPHAVAAAL
jgi:hypothetical protein